MARGKRESGHRGSGSSRRRGVRGSDDDLLETGDKEQDLLRYLKENDEDLPDPANDEYIWPTFEEEEDD